ncbi:putative ATP-dependent hsl protease ATP-binding subunit hslU [Besnoitia besnoiti]|uniref:Putative ATP-dependent hsl protease ATP-binding subunit hslU n=1 Tax=Besnoitia besnoiti TaxID=94643 RepID=A0A2A9M9D8_BESBE|nr:putative ATP-dependent hsl protease ATP-binding subunit hslU [Besnoitia besnoiti]PFH32293.1 putative ATP-dependent hsl protease ATP-binding subunit hslU [Besnoitia besnoiti]
MGVPSMLSRQRGLSLSSTVTVCSAIVSRSLKKGQAGRAHACVPARSSFPTPGQRKTPSATPVAPSLPRTEEGEVRSPCRPSSARGKGSFCRAASCESAALLCRSGKTPSGARGRSALSPDHRLLPFRSVRLVSSLPDRANGRVTDREERVSRAYRAGFSTVSEASPTSKEAARAASSACAEPSNAPGCQQDGAAGRAALPEALEANSLVPAEMGSGSENTGEGVTASPDDFARNPDEIVAALDKYIVGQDAAKRSLAISLRDRWRRQNVKDEKLRREIAPNNLLLIGPSGCGKTELAKRLASFAGAPFVKVAATRFTEVGFVGDDTSSIVHYLAQQAYADEKERMKKVIFKEAASRARQEVARALREQGAMSDSVEVITAMIKDGRLDEVEVEVDESLLQKHPEGPQDPLSALFSSLGKAMSSQRGNPFAPPGGFPGGPSPAAFGLPTPVAPFAPAAGGGRNGRGRGGSIPGISFSVPIGLFGGNNQKHEAEQRKKVKVKKAIAAMTEHFANEMTDTEDVQERAREAAENRGIVFIDEFDKLVEERSGSDNSAFRSKRVGVQRELLTLIEGTSVPTQLGVINTDHVLFIASGSFLACKPSDIIPELQGRLPVRSDLKPLTEENFVQILTETQYNLLDQQSALLATEGVKLTFEESGIREIARISHHLNTVNANVGARRLKTVLAKVLEDTKFEAHTRRGSEVVVTKEMVEERLRPLMEQADLCKYIL